MLQNVADKGKCCAHVTGADVKYLAVSKGLEQIKKGVEGKKITMRMVINKGKYTKQNQNYILGI